MSEWSKIEEVLQDGIKIEELRCVNCNRLLKEYEGKHGKFLGCPNFLSDEKCKKTYTLKK